MLDLSFLFCLWRCHSHHFSCGILARNPIDMEMSQNFKCLKNILKLLICPVYLNLNRKPLGYVGIFRSSQPSISAVKGVEGWFNLVSNGGLSRSVWDSWLGFWNRCVRISGRGWGDFRPVKFCWKTCFNQILGRVRYGKIPAIHQTVGDFSWLRYGETCTGFSMFFSSGRLGYRPTRQISVS